MSPPQEGKRRQGLGDVRIVTSPDGSRLYCCSECLMAYTDKTVLEHHLANHKVKCFYYIFKYFFIVFNINKSLG